MVEYHTTAYIVIALNGGVPYYCVHCNSLKSSQLYTDQKPVAYPGILFRGRGGGSTNPAEERGQREQGSGGGSP
jgi:hypothetical protein